MMIRQAMLATVTGALLLPSMTMADVGVGAKLGTLGAGIELTKDLMHNVNGRVGLNVLNLARNGAEDGVDYNIDLNLGSIMMVFDWHPFSGGMRLSAGAAFNNNELSLLAKPTNTSYTIGSTTYTPSEVGTLRGTVAFDDLTPYVGIGWGNAVSKDDRFTFVLDIGVLFQGSTESKLTADGTLATDPTFQSELAQEQKNLNKALDAFELYPVIALGFAYRF
ncbi:MAG: outer membrane protein domain-containing protein [Gammaproteobacteria bacterium]|nr:MAG: outer membrane protein domain-containing protein [Gammaproteobacteria bacterium]TND06249.1 MAG: outer membrane protein domain-containing protein [Gammaproteobacteria bacterium]